jgi:hypothetical protein
MPLAAVASGGGPLFAARSRRSTDAAERGISSSARGAARQQDDLADETLLEQSAAMRRTRRRIRERPTRRRSIPPGSPLTSLDRPSAVQMSTASWPSNSIAASSRRPSLRPRFFISFARSTTSLTEELGLFWEASSLQPGQVGPPSVCRTGSCPSPAASILVHLRNEAVSTRLRMMAHPARRCRRLPPGSPNPRARSASSCRTQQR